MVRAEPAVGSAWVGIPTIRPELPWRKRRNALTGAFGLPR